MAPKVSIIIPAYNVSEYIDTTIKSCVNQTWKNIEIIVVNDGSTDDTLEKLRLFKDDRLVIIDQPNAGVCAARNIGFHHSCGDFIQFLDADDALAENKIEVQLSSISHNRELSLCGWSKFDKSLSQALPIESQAVNATMTPIEWLKKAWSGGGMAQTGCWLTPRNLIEDAGPWKEDLLINNDGEFFCRVLMLAERVVFSKETMAYYRTPRNSNVSQQRSKDSYTSLLNSYVSYYEASTPFHTDNSVKDSLANNFFRFIYEVPRSYQDLIDKAYENLSLLDAKQPIAVGGRLFKLIVRLFGFKMAMSFKNTISR